MEFKAEGLVFIFLFVFPSRFWFYLFLILFVFFSDFGWLKSQYFFGTLLEPLKMASPPGLHRFQKRGKMTKPK